jgi:aarF domain-containing kinase
MRSTTTSAAARSTGTLGPLPVRPPGGAGALPSHLRRGPAGIRLPRAATSSSSSSSSTGTSVREMSSQMREVRSRMEEDEQLRVLMAGFRGSNLDASDFAASGVDMRLVSIDEDDEEVRARCVGCGLAGLGWL